MPDFFFVSFFNEIPQVAEYGAGKEIVGVIRGSIKTVTSGKKPFNEVPIYAKVAYLLGLRVSPDHRLFCFAFFSISFYVRCCTLINRRKNICIFPSDFGFLENGNCFIHPKFMKFFGVRLGNGA